MDPWILRIRMIHGSINFQKFRNHTHVFRNSGTIDTSSSPSPSTDSKQVVCTMNFFEMLFFFLTMKKFPPARLPTTPPASLPPCLPACLPASPSHTTPHITVRDSAHERLLCACAANGEPQPSTGGAARTCGSPARRMSLSEKKKLLAVVLAIAVAVAVGVVLAI